MKDLAIQAYISYLQKMIKTHEEIRAKQGEMIRLLEVQNVALKEQLKIYSKSQKEKLEIAQVKSGQDE